jgi:hypothetical protein
MTLLLQLMDLFPATEYMLFDTMSNMFAITTIASAKKAGVRRHETSVDTRTNPTPLADPATTP